MNNMRMKEDRKMTCAETLSAMRVYTDKKNTETNYVRPRVQIWV